MWKLSLFFLTCAGWTVAQSNDTGAAVDNPCAEVSRLYQESAEESLTIPAKLAYDCITSVPINAERATELMKSLIAYSEWHSTLDYLKDPPSDYAYPAIDIIKEFQNITDSIESGVYEKEYEYATEIYRVVQQSHDGHFSFQPDILFSAFEFVRTASLVSVSMDGKELPQVFSLYDLLSGDSSSPSPVTTIDGQKVTAFLESEPVHACHDPDACYNAMFYHHNVVSSSSKGLGQFSIPMKYTGESTTLAFENGTTIDVPNLANVKGNLTGIDGPEAFYERFCNISKLPEVSSFSLVSEEPTRLVPIDPYPEEVVADEFGTVAGYFMDKDGFEDVAVLLLPFFLTDPIGHQSIVEEFFKQCQQSGKTKLILDLQGNMGGVKVIPFDVFNQIFPDIESTIPERMRAHESLDTVGQLVSTALADEDIISPENVTFGTLAANVMSFNIHNRRPLDDREFASWSEFYGPRKIGNGQFTSTYKRTFEEPSYLLGGLPKPTGYGNRTTGFSRVFDDVILLTDGRCGSACSMLSYFLRNRANVKTVTIGGRAEFGPMKAVGSTRGTHVYGAFTLNIVMDWLKEVLDDDKSELLSSGKTAHLDDLPRKRSATNDFTVNMADAIQLDDESETPIQFIFEAADCRLFFTPEMISDGSAAWKAAARVMNGDYEMCVRNSTNHPTSITGSGNATIPAPGDVDDDASSSPAAKEDANVGLKTVVSTGLLIAFSAMVSLLM